MDTTPESAAIAIAADELHRQWRAAYEAQNGVGAARWKEMKPASVEWVAQKGDVPPEAVRQGAKGLEINIAALPNSSLPPQFSGENTAAATGAIQAIKEYGDADIENLAAIVHQQWLERNGSWAPEDLKKPYAELPEAEKEKDRIIVRVAQQSIAAAVTTPSTQGQEGEVSSPEAKKQVG